MPPATESFSQKHPRIYRNLDLLLLCIAAIVICTFLPSLFAAYGESSPWWAQIIQTALITGALWLLLMRLGGVSSYKDYWFHPPKWLTVTSAGTLFCIFSIIFLGGFYQPTVWSPLILLFGIAIGPLAAILLCRFFDLRKHE